MASHPQPFEYLEGLPGMVFQKLYQEPSTALSIFRRMLPRLAQTLVMGMLFVDEPLLEADMKARFKPQDRSNRLKALTVLAKLHILSKVKTAEKVIAYQLSSSFSQSLREALTGSSIGSPFGVFYDVGPAQVSLAFLDRVAVSQWEAILYYIVGSASGSELSGGTRISNFTKKLLETGDFVNTSSGVPTITKGGFGFLLQEVNSQVWTLLIVYLESCEAGSINSVDVLNFLFKLGSFHLGQAYSVRDLTDTQRGLLNQLSDFGLIYRPDPDAPYFYPTRLATTLASDAPALVSASDPASRSVSTTVIGLDQPTSQNYIVVETNYRLYAYVSSPLQICILSLFVRLNTRFPNMVSGKITKGSITRAFTRGITADQVIVYLQRHAHPQMRKSPQILPPTVVDQIKLWQMEGDQFVSTPGFLISQFSSSKEYEEVKRYANSLGVVVWSSDEKKMFFVSHLDQLRDYLSNRQLRQQGNVVAPPKLVSPAA